MFLRGYWNLKFQNIQKCSAKQPEIQQNSFFLNFFFQFFYFFFQNVYFIMTLDCVFIIVLRQSVLSHHAEKNLILNITL